MQHGPLYTFHMYLSQGVALVKYGSREEAAKVGVTPDSAVRGCWERWLGDVCWDGVGWSGHIKVRCGAVGNAGLEMSAGTE